MTTLDYELHKLGWRAFQDLCGVILQQSLGQTFTVFADSNDVGQDGAFAGTWATPHDDVADDLKLFSAPGLAVVAQCKFSSNSGVTLTPSDLAGELAKVGALHAQGQCDGYLVITNQRVTGRTKSWLVDEVRKLGPQHVAILPGTWICSQIEQSWNLRRYVPRVYGLGDLGRILDDRRLRQAKALLTGLQTELETFVPTSAYRQASDALAKHGFVLLLGEPACGKSTIAATLSMTALDHWGCGVLRVNGPDELVDHWDPDDPTQLFWVDDAFGAIRHDSQLTDAWTRRMDQVMAAVGHGAKVLLTSRDYIYRDAKPLLKEYAYPRLRENQVVVDVANLSVSEKRQILYNHLKAGDQERSRLEAWSPHLKGVASLRSFQPEIARRLSLRAFTPADGLRGAEALQRYFEHPREFLAEVMDGLEPAHRAAMASVYLSGGELVAPFDPSPRTRAAVEALGATVASTGHAFASVDGTFLAQAETANGDVVWRFRHPTIREGFAESVGRNVQTVAVMLDGMTDDEMLSELDCGGDAERGTLTRVPRALYGKVIPRVVVRRRRGSEHEWFNRPAWFVTNRCSDEFLRLWAAHHADGLKDLLGFGMFLDAYWEPRVLGRLTKAGAIPENVRLAAAATVLRYAVDHFDPGWARDEVRQLFTADEYAELLRRFEEDVVPDIERYIDDAGDGWEDSTRPEERFRTAREAVAAIRDVLSGNSEVANACAAALDYIAGRISEAEREYEEPGESDELVPQRPTSEPDTENARDQFDDVGDGH
jgi:energy-coupling factor transporter ATP-binding protein EcfA2